MSRTIALSSCLGTVALLALAWWCLFDNEFIEPIDGAARQSAEVATANPSSDRPMVAPQGSEASLENTMVPGHVGMQEHQGNAVEMPRVAAGPFLRRWEEMQLMFPKNPFSTEWWRWRLGFERELAEESLKASASQGGGAEKARLEYARALDRIAIACLLDRQGSYIPCENNETVSKTDGDKVVIHEYLRHYTFLPNEFPEWATLARLQQSFNEEDGTLADASDRLSGAVQDARRRFAEALKAVGG